MRAWKVEPKDGFVTEAGNYMRAGCAHRRNVSACGGCYARLVTVLDEIERAPGDALALVREVTKAMRSEAEGR